MAAAATAPAGQARPRLPVARGGPRYWAYGYWRMLAWDLADLRLQLPILACVLILQGAGFVLGIGLLFGHMPEPAATFVVTGLPVVNLVTAGLIFEPQIVADQRAAGSYEFLQSMPAPRGATAMAWYTVALITAVAVSLTGVLMGYAVAHAITVPMIARLVSVSLIFVSFGFSPIMFPAGQLPGRLAQVNRWLPFGSMATIMRSALITGIAAGVGRAYLVVAAWAVVSGLIAAWAVGRRG